MSFLALYMDENQKSPYFFARAKPTQHLPGHVHRLPDGDIPALGGSSPLFCEAWNLPLPHWLTRKAMLAEARCHKAGDLCRNRAFSVYRMITPDLDAAQSKHMRVRTN